MDDQTLLIELVQEMRFEIKEMREELAELRGQRKAYGGLAGWFNGILLAVFAAYVEWKFNQLK